MNEIEIYEHKLDYMKIINDCLNKEGWGKKYTLYQFKRMVITCEMESFEFNKNKANLRVRVTHPSLDAYWDSTLIEISLDNMDINFIEQYVKKRILSKLNDVERETLKNEAERKYFNAYYSYVDVSNNDIVNAGYDEELNDLDNISNNDMREAARDILVEKVQELLNEHYDSLCAEYIRDTKLDADGFHEIKDRISGELKE